MIQTIEKKLEVIEDALLFITNLHANNEIVLFSPLISTQVGNSHAAHAFNVVQRALFELEVTRLLAVWDVPRVGEVNSTKNSFPAIAKLLEAQHVKNGLVCNVRQAHAAGPVINVNLSPNALNVVKLNWASDAALMASKKIDEVIQRIGVIATSNDMLKLRNFRDKHIAHLLEQTNREQKSGTAIAMPKFAAQNDLLIASLALHADILTIVKLQWMDWSVWTDTCNRNASYLWNSCTIKPVR